MAWTSPRTWTAGELVTATIMNTHVRDNLSYLVSRPGFGTVRDNNADYSTTSGTFTPVDSTYLAGTVTTLTGFLDIRFNAQLITSSVAAPTFCVDIEVDGTRIGASATKGLWSKPNGVVPLVEQVNISVRQPVSAGAHVVRPVWLINSGTAFLLAGTTTYQDVLPSLYIQEVA